MKKRGWIRLMAWMLAAAMMLTDTGIVYAAETGTIWNQEENGSTIPEDEAESNEKEETPEDGAEPDEKEETPEDDTESDGNDGTPEDGTEPDGNDGIPEDGTEPDGNDGTPEDGTEPDGKEETPEDGTEPDGKEETLEDGAESDGNDGTPEDENTSDGNEELPGDESKPAGKPVTVPTVLQSANPKTAAEQTLRNLTVTGIKIQTYTGKALTPKVTVKNTQTGKTLKLGKDYQISYENNVNAGIGVIVIRGISSNAGSGTLRVNFTIQPQNVAKKVSAKVVGKKFLYTGSPVTPEAALTYNRMSLIKDQDYELSYKNHVYTGTAQILIAGKGNYTGTKTITFKITSPKMSDTQVRLISSSEVFESATAYPAVEVVYAGGVCQEGRDYQVKYPANLKAGKNSITVLGKGNFSGSAKLTYTLSKASISDAKVSIPYAWKYTKKSLQIVPSSVQVNGVALVNKKDYTIKFSSPFTGKTMSSVKEEGAYEIVLTGKGNYSGTKKLDIYVTAEQSILDQNYDSGEEKEPEPPAPDTVYTENKVPADHDRYWGYYEQYHITSKKGIQGTSAYTEDLGVQHVLLNVDLADMISMTPKAGYVPYTYQGVTYYFGDLIALKDTIYYLHGWGAEDNPYGANHMRNVTLVLLMSWKDDLSWLIHPSARKKGAAPYYALNMQDKKARDTYEALFRYMGEWLGQYKTRVSNWTLGNEVNSCKAWNYSGNMNLQQCVANYGEAFRLLYKGVKRTATSSRVFVSLDHCWTASVAGHSGKAFLDEFAAYMAKTDPSVEWHVNYHPYSNPLSKTDFWNDRSTTTDREDTKYISIRNLNVLTDYLSKLETKYGKTTGSIRVILGEFGYSATGGKAAEEQKQAAALGYGYYLVMGNKRVDSYIIRAYQDAPEEGSLKLGLRTQKDVEKESYDVYKFIDTEDSLDVMKPYLSIVGLKDWNEIPGFRAEDLPAVDF